jgi:hypothetical protein
MNLLKKILVMVIVFNVFAFCWDGKSTLKELSQYSSHIIEGKVVEIDSK